MGDYVRGASYARSGRSASVVSVGDSIELSQVYNSAHPLYKAYSAKLQEHIANIVARESEKAAKAQQAVCTVSLGIEEKNEVIREYPEFRVVWPEWRVPVHAAWVARRELVNQYMQHHVRSYAATSVHYGGSALAAITSGNVRVQLCTDTTSAVAVHEAFEDDVMVTKLCASAASASAELGWHVDVDLLPAYASGETLRKSSVSQAEKFRAEATIVDGSVGFFSPMQFAAAMLQHGSDIGMFAFPYHPAMLMHRCGELYGTGVHYTLDDECLRLQYPDGVAGITEFPAAVWHQWLVNTVRSVAGAPGISFQYELMGRRGPFMLVRVVKSDTPMPKEVKFVHTLQLEGTEDLTLVRTWRLKSLAVDPCVDESWEPLDITVPTRVIEKTHAYAMSLSPEQFSRHAIRKRLAVTNDRVVIQGTTVKVNDAMTSEHLDHLETAIFAHCFVARYETGQLASALRKVVDSVADFGRLSSNARSAHVLVATSSVLYDWTLGAIDQRLRDLFERVRSWLGHGRVRRKISFEPSPQFIRYETIVSRRALPLIDRVRLLLTSVTPIQSVVPTMPGFRFLASLGGVVHDALPTVPAIDLQHLIVRARAHLFADVVDTSTGGADTETADELVNVLQELNEFDMPGSFRHDMSFVTHESGIGEPAIKRDDYQFDPGYITTLDDFHEAIVPGMRAVDFKYDPASISVDDQNRSLAAEYLDLPLDFGDMPKSMHVFPSHLAGYNVTKRPITVHEYLSSVHARNLSAPVLALPQHEGELVRTVWEDFLEMACLPDAREKLHRYQNDPVGLEEQALRDWTGKARPENVVKVFKYFVENPDAWEELRLGRYESMPKTDVKPPLSDKPLHSRVEPQVIVHHISAVNAIFSSIFRVLVRRFLSLLKPNIMVNLLKDITEVQDMIQAHHDWSTTLKFLENDFSKYDKSQGLFVHLLEQFVFEQLGMNARMLEAWGLGHVDCSIRSVTTGVSLSVRYQRKSGDATTAFGNAITNIMCVMHAYKGTDIVWAVFMGDDSLIAARIVCSGEIAVRTLAEKFNLQAKFFITDAPYFASNFILLHANERTVTCVPDPLKRVERWSMAVSAVEPKWEERYISAVNSLKVYRARDNLVGLDAALYTRYGSTDRIDFQSVCDAVASAIRSFDEFRQMWHEDATHIVF